MGTSGSCSANIAAQAAILRIIQSVDSVVATQAGTVTLRLLVPNGSCSLLIGKKGVQINQISSDSGAKIQIARAEEMPAELQAVERLVIIESRTSEAEQQVTSACAMISDKLGDAIDSGVGGGDFSRQPQRPAYQQQQPTYQQQQPMQQMYHNSPPMGAMQPMQQPPPMMPPAVPSMQQMQQSPYGAPPPPAYQQPPPPQYADASSSPRMQTQPQYGSSMQTQPQYGAAAGISSGPDTPVHMLIPSSQVGRAIGKGGSVIKQVSALCGNSVQIQIEKDDHPAATNKMGVPMRQIGATAPSVELAHKALGLLLTTVHNHEPESNWTMICVPVATQDL